MVGSFVFAVALAIVAVGTGPAPAEQAPEPDIELKLVEGGLSSPVALVDPDDGKRILYIVQQGGRILVRRAGEILANPLLDVSDSIAGGGERGLLGLAFHPSFPEDRRFFVFYTAEDGALSIAEYRARKGGLTAVPDSGRVLLSILHPAGTTTEGGLHSVPMGSCTSGPVTAAAAGTRKATARTAPRCLARSCG